MHKLAFARALTLGLTLLPSTVLAAPPTVVTLAPTGIGLGSVTFHGDVTADGGAFVSSKGFVYSVNSVDPTPQIGEAEVTNLPVSSGVGSYQGFVFSGLSSATTYAVAAYAINADGTSYGAVLTFTTLPPRETLISNQPAATLLLPYFEVDLNNPQGVTTLFSINSATDDAVLTNVVIWSDLGVPVLNFNVYLTGYDVQAINLRDILVAGLLPRTASFAQDPVDNISPKGPISSDASFASCSDILPYENLDGATLAHVQASLTGQASPLTGQCSAVSYSATPQLARGYVTVDTVSACGLSTPATPGYFISGGLGLASNQNVLWGDYFYVNPELNRAEGDPLVHITADAADLELNTPGQYTFYGRHVSYTAADNREPLATSFAIRYVNYDFKEPKKNRPRERTKTLGTDLVVWRDPKVPQGPFSCGSLPAWYPLGQEGIVFFDEVENPQIPQPTQVAPVPPDSGPVPFRAATQRVKVNTPDLPTLFSAGWMYLNLNAVVSGSLSPPEDPAAAQAWVTPLYDIQRNGRFSVGFRGVRLDSAKTPTHLTPGS